MYSFIAVRQNILMVNNVHEGVCSRVKKTWINKHTNWSTIKKEEEGQERPWLIHKEKRGEIKVHRLILLEEGLQSTELTGEKVWMQGHR